MADVDKSVRTCCSQAFNIIMRLLPLENENVSATMLSPILKEEKKKHEYLINCLLNGKHIEDYVVPVKINATLRTYQQQGINW